MQGELAEYFHVKIAPDRLTAEIYCARDYHEQKVPITKQIIDQLLNDNRITSGIKEENVAILLTSPSISKFPITIAEGIPAKAGKCGEIIYKVDHSSKLKKTNGWNFREVMRIPSVQKGQKLAKVTLPTDGIDGMDIHGSPIRARKGSPVIMRAGKNVVFKESDSSFFAIEEGQINVFDQTIEVQPIFEVSNSLSMETGNIDFIGSVVIQGDVPTGYTVKAKGDVKIHGIVEAATITSGGSVYISEGLAGLQKGTIQAKEDIHVGYINQGIVQANGSIYVENSILHSECEAAKDIYCQNGNVIGGSLSAGQTIEAKNIGNRLNTKTEISLGVSRKTHAQEQKLLTKKEELLTTLKNLDMIGKKLELRKAQDKQIQLTLLRQKSSYAQTVAQLNKTNIALNQLKSSIGDEKLSKLIVNNHLYDNTFISFGKYKRKIDATHHFVHIFLNKNEILIYPLHEMNVR